MVTWGLTNEGIEGGLVGRIGVVFYFIHLKLLFDLRFFAGDGGFSSSVLDACVSDNRDSSKNGYDDDNDEELNNCEPSLRCYSFMRERERGREEERKREFLLFPANCSLIELTIPRTFIPISISFGAYFMLLY